MENEQTPQSVVPFTKSDEQGSGSKPKPATASKNPSPANDLAPSQHVNHDDLFIAELKHRLSGFQIGKTALESKIAGIKAEYLKAVEDAALKRDRALAPEEKSYKQILKSIRIAEAALEESEVTE